MATETTPTPWSEINANGGGLTIRTASGKWVRATPADVAAMKVSTELLAVLSEWFPLLEGHFEGRSYMVRLVLSDLRRDLIPCRLRFAVAESDSTSRTVYQMITTRPSTGREH